MRDEHWRGRRYEVEMNGPHALTGRAAGALVRVRPAGAGRLDSPARSDVAEFGDSSGQDEPRGDQEPTGGPCGAGPVSYTHLRAHETSAHL
eukprot:5138684-Alexandrium_andersonii.AAC.1